MNKPTESTDPAKGLPAVKNHAALSAMDRSTIVSSLGGADKYMDLLVGDIRVIYTELSKVLGENDGGLASLLSYVNGKTEQ